MITVVILGAGNVAKHLCKAFESSTSVRIIQGYNRQKVEISPTIPVTDQYEAIAEADVYLLCVSDAAIAEVSERIPYTDRLVVHTGGGISIDAIAPKHRAGVWYPLQTFSADKEINFTQVPVCIEATSDEDLTLLHTLATALSPKVYELSTTQRNALHLAAVFVNNFTNHLYTIGNEICETHQLPFEILYPLLQETAQKIVSLPPYEAQTGPAIRKDQKTITKHLELLTNPTHKELYTTLTQTIQDYYGKKL